MVRLIWTKFARQDLKGIAEYIARDSVNYARIQVQRITIKTKVLKLQPYSGRIVPEVNEENVRELIEGNYRIIYEIVDDHRIDILTIHHSSRDLNRRKFLLNTKPILADGFHYCKRSILYMYCPVICSCECRFLDSFRIRRVRVAHP